jgi:DNA-binding response OmpR family regulator
MEAKVNVLILEDSKVLNNFLYQRFSNDEYFEEVYQAFSLREAKNILENKKIDYLILDLSLPDGSGKELLRAKTHTIVLTATTDISTRDEIFKKGAIDYFSKKDRLDIISKNIIKLIKKIENNKNYNVLIVDDSELLRKQSKAIFKIRNYNVIEACNGKEALDIIESSKIDMVILDLEMPIMGGEELLEELKARELDEELSIVVVSGTNDRDLISRVLKNGANEFIKKPHSIEEIYLRSEIAFNHGLSQRELKEVNKNLQEKVKSEIDKNLAQEKQLLQKSRDDVMSDMMGTVMHQWKQPIAYLFSCCATLKEEKNLDEKVQDNISQIESQIRYMKSTLDDFSSFFSGESTQERYDLNKSVDKVLKTLIRPYSMVGIKIIKKTKEPMYTKGYSAELMQVVINLLNNSRDAILEYKPQHPIIDVRLQAKDDRVMLAVTDYAGGVPTEVLDEIFKAYYSTKDKKVSNGISLDMSKTIVEKVDGKIYAENIKKGEFRGARFVIELPMVV